MLMDDSKLSRTETAVVAGNVLTRAGLRSLLEKYAYRVLCTAESVDQLLQPLLTDKPKLVLIAPDSLEDLAAQASVCRTQWPDSRIVAIYDCMNAGDNERVRASSANGCVSTKVSERSLLDLLDLLLRDDEDLFFMLQLRSGAARPTRKLHSTLSDSAGTPDAGASSALNGDATPCLKRNATTYVREDEVPVVIHERANVVLDDRGVERARVDLLAEPAEVHAQGVVHGGVAAEPAGRLRSLRGLANLDARQGERAALGSACLDHRGDGLHARCIGASYSVAPGAGGSTEPSPVRNARAD